MKEQYCKLPIAVILAAGQGKRMNSECKEIKPFVDVSGKYLICHIIDNLLYFGIKDIYIIKYRYDSFDNLLEKYQKSSVNLHIINDDKQIGSLYSFSLISQIHCSSFLCVDCDVIAKPKQMAKMLQNGFEIIKQGEVMGVMAMAENPQFKDANMLRLKQDRVIRFIKQGDKRAVRGGYIYIWKSAVLKHCKEFIENKNYSLSAYIDYVVQKYIVKVMKIDDIWDVDTYEDILQTNQRMESKKEWRSLEKY